jgi:hypothetical protein
MNLMPIYGTEEYMEFKPIMQLSDEQYLPTNASVEHEMRKNFNEIGFKFLPARIRRRHRHPKHDINEYAGEGRAQNRNENVQNPHRQRRPTQPFRNKKPANDNRRCTGLCGNSCGRSRCSD